MENNNKDYNASDNTNNSSNNNNNNKNHIKISTELYNRVKDNIDNTYICLDNIQKIHFEELSEIYNFIFNIKYIFKRKSDLVNEFIIRLLDNGYSICGNGILSILNDYGFIRSEYNGFITSEDNVFVSSKLCNYYGLRSGDYIKYIVFHRSKEEKRLSARDITHIHGIPIKNMKIRKLFDEITPEYPKEKFKLTENLDQLSPNAEYALRLIDMVAPFGKGQRMLISAEPKSGKTMLLHFLIESIIYNHDETDVVLLLISERPEEITDVKKKIKKILDKKGIHTNKQRNIRVFYADFTKKPNIQVDLAELCVKYVESLFTLGRHVALFIDSLTRLTRAFNNVASNSGRSLSGGVDANALYRAKSMFGRARNTLYEGSVTVSGTGLTGTKSRMDELIITEFIGTGNSEINLSRKIADKGIFPAIDIPESGTRRTDKLCTMRNDAMYKFRSFSQNMTNINALKIMLAKLKEIPDNEKICEDLSKLKVS